MKKFLIKNEHLVDAINEFHFSVYSQLKGPDNLAYSPLRLYILLVILQEGARGITRSCLLEALHWKYKSARLTGSVGALIGSLQKEKTQRSDDKEIDLQFARREGKLIDDFPENVKLHHSSVDDVSALLQWNVTIGNAIWLASQFSVDPRYRDRIQRSLFSVMKSLDFQGDSERAAIEINAWVNDKTQGRINSIVSPGLLNENTRMVATSTILFAAPWHTSFKEDGPGIFKRFDGLEIKCKMISIDSPSAIGLRTDEFEAAELPYRVYKGRRFSMTVILPKQPGRAAFIECENNLTRYWAQFQKAKKHADSLKVTMPEFEVSADLDFKTMFVEMGLGLIFSFKADFTGIHRSEPLYVDAIKQKVKINVDRFGTVAAAATFGPARYGWHSRRFDHLLVDRPFLFIISDSQSGLILFAGKLVDL
jgi:serpin B